MLKIVILAGLLLCQAKKCGAISRQKLNAIDLEFNGKNVLLVDDSIVRGTTSKEIIQMAREAGAKKVYFASAAPEVRYPNVYGIDMPSSQELIAHTHTQQKLQNLLAPIGWFTKIYKLYTNLRNRQS